MSYLVLARKWRPQVFEEVAGQRTITQTLQNAISQNRVAHAFLFTGARGVGKTSTARILAKALNCEKGPVVNPCNQCAACQEITNGNSMDVIEIDGASNRGIEEIRELRENVRYTPAKGRYKIYIIDEVHMLTREAFNALLKTLEEPPPHIIFIFATTEPHKIPPTILSRCQRYDFKRIPLRDIIENLKRIVEKEGIGITPRGLLTIARKSEGSMRDAQSLLDQVISYGGKDIRDEDIVEVLGLIDQKIIYNTIEAIADRDPQRCLRIVDHIYHHGFDIQQFFLDLLQYLRDLILLKVSNHPEEFVELPEDELDFLKRQAERFQFNQLDHLFNLLLKGEEGVSQSTFPRTMLEITLIRMATLHPVLPIDQILKKLENIEKTYSLTKPTEPLILEENFISTNSNIEFGMNEGFQKTEDEGSKEELLEREQEEDEFKVEIRGESMIDKEETWKGLLDFTRAKNPILGAFLSFGNLINLDNDRMEIGFENESFHYDRMLERENHKLLESICSEYLGRKTKIIISAFEKGNVGNGVKNQGSSSRNNLNQRMKSESGSNSIIQEALRIFNGRIVEK